MKKISVITPCFNEQDNVDDCYNRVKAVFDALPDYDYEHIFADNASTDKTYEALTRLAAQDKKVKVIGNIKNFGPARSQYNAILSASGDAVILLAADLQDPPEIFPDFIAEWEKGNKIVFGQRAKRAESGWLQFLRKVYYRLLKHISEDDIIPDAGDFVLFDGSLLPAMRQIRDRSPFVRGLLPSIGGPIALVPYTMAERKHGKSKATPFHLFSYALNSFSQHTLFPLRMASLVGMIVAFFSLLYGFIQLVLKLIYWDFAMPGIPTLIIGMFFLGGVQLFILGFIGEHVGSLYRQSKGTPLVVERERINFDE